MQRAEPLIQRERLLEELEHVGSLESPNYYDGFFDEMLNEDLSGRNEELIIEDRELVPAIQNEQDENDNNFADDQSSDSDSDRDSSSDDDFIDVMGDDNLMGGEGDILFDGGRARWSVDDLMTAFHRILAETEDQDLASENVIFWILILLATVITLFFSWAVWSIYAKEIDFYMHLHHLH